MAILDQINARLAEAQSASDQLDAKYKADRIAMDARLAALQRAALLVTPQIQAVVDALGAIISLPGSK